jgi:hypothetical protein
MAVALLFLVLAVLLWSGVAGSRQLADDLGEGQDYRLTDGDVARLVAVDRPFRDPD